MAKVARLYHTHRLRQTEIAERLNISQSRVSRLLTQAEEAALVRTVVSITTDGNVELEESIESRYGLADVHVIDAVSTHEGEIHRDLAVAAASILHEVAPEAPTIGFTSWSHTFRQMVDALERGPVRSTRVVEMLGDLGPPLLGHDAAHSAQKFASLTGGQPVFLRIPGVSPTPAIKEALLQHDPYARQALRALDDLDLAFVGIGSCEVTPPLRAGENYFTQEQLDEVVRLGAVGQLCLRFLDAGGQPVPNSLDDTVIGVTLAQLRSARRRWGVAGGVSKHAAIRAALVGGWIDVLVTDAATAAYLVPPDGPQSNGESPGGG